MHGKIKTLALAIAAISVMSMAVGAGAQATQIHATVNQEQAVIHGEAYGANSFVTDVGSVSCTQITFEGTASKTATNELTLTPTFTGCQAFGQASTTDMNGCKFVLTGKNQSGVTIGGGTVNVDITGCTTNADNTHKSIEITTGICRMSIPQQHNLSHIVLTNNTTGSPHDVTADITISKLHYTTHGPLCPSVPPGNHTTTKTNGTFTAQATFQAYESLGQEQVTHNGHQYKRHIRSAAKGLQVT